MSVKHYHELKDLANSQRFEGIDYLFGNEQVKRYLEKHGYADEDALRADIKAGKLTTDGYGGIGTPEAFKKRDAFYAEINERIKKECTGDDVFEAEWWNHECGLTYDSATAVILTQHLFPGYLPSVKLLNRLQKEFNRLN